MRKEPKFKTLSKACLPLLACMCMAGIDARADYNSLILADKPQAYYPMDLTNGTATDLTGNGCDGTYVNIYPGYNNVPGPSTYLTNGVSFDGLTTYVDLSTGSNAAALNFGGQITLEAWVQPNASTANGYIIGKGYDSSAGGNEIEMRAPGFGAYQGGTYNFTNGNQVATGGSITTNWAHVVLNYDGTQWNLYVNALLVGTQADTNGPYVWPAPWAIGDGTRDGGTRIFPGNITAVAIYTNALSAQKIAAHYIYGLNGTTNVAPMFTLQPSPVVAVPGSTVTFSASVLSAPAYTSQWYAGSTLIPGATNLSLTLTNVTTNSTGNYTVKVTSTAGTSTSSPANLLVLAPGPYGVSPLPLTPGSFNEDTIVENTAIPSATTASMDNGLGNYGYSWFETGFDSQSVGLPAAGSTFTSVSQSDHSFQMAPSYTGNDAFMIDSAVSNATITLSSPAPYSGLSFLLASGGGGVGVNYVVHHADGSSESGSITSPDWFGAGTVAFNVNGRVDVRSRGIQTWGSGGPALSSTDIVLNNTTSAVQSVSLSWGSGGGNAGILAISGSTGSGFSPIPVTGYNEDMIVEAGAQGFSGGTYTTASMDNSTANTGYTWYEDGFEVPGRGIPKHGTSIVSHTQADHFFDMPASYTTNDVSLIDANTTNTITFANPAKIWRMSFLGAGGHGPVSVNYLLHHADLTTETGSFSLPDWFGGGTVAWDVDGRVDAQSGGLQTWGIGSGVIKLFSTDIGITNINSAVTSVDLSFGSGNQNGANVQIFAVSGAFISESLRFTSIANANGQVALKFAGIPNYRYVAQYTTNLGSPSSWVTIGTNTADASGIWQYVDTQAGSRPKAFYRAQWLP